MRTSEGNANRVIAQDPRSQVFRFLWTLFKELRACGMPRDQLTEAADIFARAVAATS
jgi:hypothetical protein